MAFILGVSGLTFALQKIITMDVFGMSNKGNGVTFISAQTRFDGDVLLENTAVVAGQLRGKIESTGLVKIELGGEISGELTCQELRVSGRFTGKLRCKKLTIVSSGVVEGEVSSHQMEVYDGGQFIGQRTQGPAPEVLLVAPEQVGRSGDSINNESLATDTNTLESTDHNSDLHQAKISSFQAAQQRSIYQEPAPSQTKRGMYLAASAAAGILAVAIYAYPNFMQNFGDMMPNASVISAPATSVTEAADDPVATSASADAQGSSMPIEAGLTRDTQLRYESVNDAQSASTQTTESEEDLAAMEQAHLQLSAGKDEQSGESAVSEQEEGAIGGKL